MSRFKRAIRPIIYTKTLFNSVSGGGKTYSALRVATGMQKAMAENGEETRIAFIGSEQQRDLIYANEFDYDILQLEEPFTPESYIEAMDDAIDEGYKIIIVDSITHEWSGTGGVLEIHSNIPGNSYTAWKKVTPRHNAFLDKLIESPVHVLATVRGKDEVVLEEVNGKQVPKKVGMGYDQRNNLEFLFTTSFNIDKTTNVAMDFKDNTHLFENNARILTEKDGEKLYKWAVEGSDEEIIQRADTIEKSKEEGKKLAEEELEKDDKKPEGKSEDKQEDKPKRTRTRARKSKLEELDGEDDSSEQAEDTLSKSEGGSDTEGMTQAELYDKFKETFKQAKAKNLKLSDVKRIIKPSGEDTIKQTTDTEVIKKAIELLTAEL